MLWYFQELIDISKISCGKDRGSDTSFIAQNVHCKGTNLIQIWIKQDILKPQILCLKTSEAA